MAAYVELYVDQGATFSHTLTLTNDQTNTTINVAGYNVTSQMRHDYTSANATANLSCSISDAANGEVTISLTAGETANIDAGRYVFDVYTEDLLNVKSRILEGIITVTPGVTR
jgi:L-ribulose-5-phosphate 3-epimerase UlaE